MPFIGNQLSTSFQNVETQTITGDGSTAYTLNNAVADGKDLLVYINNVKQEEGSGKSYTASGTTITFTEAVASTDSCYVVFIGQAIGTVTPKDGSIVSSMLADANLEMPNTLDLNGKEFFLDADADTSITADTDDTIDIKIAGSDVYQITATKVDLNGKELVLDADADTSITADTDDQIDIRVGGSDLVKLTDSTLTLTSATASRPGIVLESTNADANPPFLRFQKNGSSPADNDEIAAVQFYADDDGGNVFVAGQIKVYSDDVSDGSEDSSITFSNINAGTANNCMQFNPTETVFNESSVDRDFRVESNGNANMLFVDAGNDSVVIGHNAEIPIVNANVELSVIGTGSTLGVARFGGAPTIALAASASGTVGSFSALSDDDSMGHIFFGGDDGTDIRSAGASISAAVDGTPGSNDMPGRLVFSTTADGASSPTERMRINNTGNVAIGNNNPADDTPGIGIQFDVSSSTTSFMNIGHTTGAGTSDGFVRFHRNGSIIGQIRTDGVSNVQYATSSDYRLKENIVTEWDATTRLKQLKPSRFNFKEEKDRTRDGFIAHEVSSIVPEAVGGEKDAMTKEVLYVEGDKIPEGKKVGDVKKPSKIDPQTIDHSKLVPLMVKTIQELEARIATLESK